jgi:hypothetical protein
MTHQSMGELVRGLELSGSLERRALLKAGLQAGQN